ncbi:IS110 family transposase [Reyranella sp. CPCC 100927]|uniref:IS110 family transposase n=1 Tax=Reyranella sp. CPCC 100927 TaxID=2599616 RepID=UPI0011B7F013|nr:IS110 family transposase [Reyranella sp. CPCC 100927]TWT04020.1 IS110 family transposase [Reyranella sp. CPCC 100927]
MKSSQHTDTPVAVEECGTLYVAFELGKASWQVGIVLSGSRKLSRYVVDGGDIEAAWKVIRKAQEKAQKRLGLPVRIVSCYEAGYDGFWLHRELLARGVESLVLDAASIQVNRRSRRAKTDRLDLEHLIRVLMRHDGGEPRVCSVVRAPSVEQEDARRPWRERDRLVEERNAHVNRIKGLLHGQGVRDVQPRAKGFLEQLKTARTGDGRAVPANLVVEIRDEHERLALVDKQITRIEAEAKAARTEAKAGSMAARINQLIELKGLGPVSAQLLVGEVFWRDFQNRRQVGAYFGLTGTPYDSGQSAREQGISKAGNGRAREMAVELAWLWRRNQPGSALSRWFNERVGTQKGRIRRITIVAVARKLMVALWRFLEHGVVPEGAVLRAAPQR